MGNDLVAQVRDQGFEQQFHVRSVRGFDRGRLRAGAGVRHDLLLSKIRPRLSEARVASGMRTVRAPRGNSASRRETQRLLQSIVAPEDFRADCERRRTENAELARGIGRLLRQTLALRALGAG